MESAVSEQVEKNIKENFSNDKIAEDIYRKTYELWDLCQKNNVAFVCVADVSVKNPISMYHLAHPTGNETEKGSALAHESDEKTMIDIRLNVFRLHGLFMGILSKFCNLYKPTRKV